ncbi:MAG: NUDIX domain-containing protein [Floccifex sp.]
MLYGKTTHVLVCMKEYLDVVDEMGNPTGQIIERNIAHQKGIRHRTSHVWLFRKKENNIEILLQKRSPQKDSFPNCFDISTAGHIPAGDSFLDSAIREAKEELGIDLVKEKCIDCGIRTFEYKGNFHQKPFHDVQVSKIFAYECNQDLFDFQTEEIQNVCWMKYQDVIFGVEHHLWEHCIYLEELKMIEKAWL